MKIELVISFDQLSGAVQVSGPIEQKFVCYGMLEMARDAIAAYKKTALVPVHDRLGSNGKA